MFQTPLSEPSFTKAVYYESRKRELKRRLINEGRWVPFVLVYSFLKFIGFFFALIPWTSL